MCVRTVWLGVGKDAFMQACKEKRIGTERAEALWARLNELAKEQTERVTKAHAEMKPQEAEPYRNREFEPRKD